MPDNRLTLTIEAQNLAQAAFKQLQADVRQSNEALKRTDQTARQSGTGIKVIRDELGRFHDAVTGQFVSRQRLLQEGFTEVGKAATRSIGPIQQLGKQAGGLDQLYRAGQQIGDAFIKMPGPIGRTSQAIQRAGRNVAHLTDQFIGLYRSSGAVRQLGREFRFLQNNIQATSGAAQQLTRHLTAQTQSIIQEAANLERLKLGLVAVTGSIQEADTQYRSFLETARTPGVFFRGVFEESLQLQALGADAEFAERAVRSVGNALALVGGNEAIFQRALYGLRQIIIDQRVLQRELNIFTQRIPQSIPFLRGRFGGARAEDIRDTLDAEGVRRTDQSNVFVKELIEFLETLPSASDTAANALENFGDTSRRLQGNIGEGLLPIVKEVVTGIEQLFLSLENDQSFKTAAADSLAFATAMGTVTAGVLGVAAAAPLLAGLANPIGVTALAAGALAGAFVKAEVAAARFRAEYDRTQTALQRGLEAGREEDTGAIERNIEVLEARRRFLQDRIAEERNAAEEEASGLRTAGLATTHLEDESLRVTVEDQTQAILERNKAYQTYQGQLFQVDKAIEVLTRRHDSLSESAEKAAKTTVDAVSQAFQSLTASASGTDAQIAEALQRFEAATESADKQVRDLALDIGDQLIAIAEATTVAQIDASKRRVDALARDNSLILEGSKQLQALLLAGEEAFAARRKELRQDEFRLEVHDEGAQAQTEALVRFYDLQSTVQEDARLDAQQSAEAQATAYIKAYRDSIDPAILHLVESVKLLRAEVRGNIQDLEALQRQDAFRLELRGEIGAEQRDALAELFDLQQAVQGDLTQNQIDNLNKRAEALKATLADETLSLQSYVATVTAIEEQLGDKRLALLEDVVSARIAAFEDDAKAAREAEDRKQQKAEETHDFHTYLNGLRRKSLQEATQELARLEERALDASSQRQRENVIRDTAQFVDAYAERGQVFRDLVADAQDLGVELQDTFDLTEQTERMEDFRDSVAGVIEDLAGITIDHFWGSFTDGASAATDAVEDFTTRAGDAIRILESDIIRLQRFNEDSDIRGERLQEDRERRIAQLRRQQQALAARAPTGNQQALERNIQQRQDIAFRIRELREDFGVRISRQAEDAERRRERLIEDALRRRERFEARGSDDSLIEKLVNSLAGSLANTLSSTISSAIAGALSGALSGQFTDLIDAIKGFFGGGGDTGAGTGTGDRTGTTDVTGSLDIPSENITLPQDALDLKGAIALAATDITAPAESVTLTGAIALTTANITPPAEPVALSGVITATLVKAFTEPVPITGIINAKVNPITPDAIDLSGLPVTLPHAAVEVTTPESVDLSAVPVTGIPAQTVEVNAPSGVDLSGVPVTLPHAAIEVTTPESIDLSDVAVTLPAQRTLDVNVPTEFDLSNASFVLPPGQALDVNVPTGFDLSQVPVSLPPAALEVATPDHFDLSGVPVTLPDARLDVQLNLPDPELLPPIDLGGLRLTNTPTVQIPYTLTPTDGGEPTETGTGGTSTETTPAATGTTAAQTALNEERNRRRQQAQGAATPTDVTAAQVIAGLADRVESSGFFNPLKEAAELLQNAVSAILSSGVSVGGDGVGIGAGGSGLDTGQIARDLAADLEGSFRSDVVPTLLGNQPGQVQPGTADPDDETAQAPQAPGARTQLLTEGLATESTLQAVSGHLSAIAANSALLTELPLIQSLAGQGISGEDAQTALNLGERQTDLLTALQSAQGLAGPGPDLSQIGGTGSPLHIKDVDISTTRKVEVVNLPETQKVQVTNEVNVKQVGVVQVAQSGEWVIQLASGATIPVYVQGGHVTADIAGGLEGLAIQLADEEVGLRAVGAI